MSEMQGEIQTDSTSSVNIVAVVEAILHISDEPIEARALAATLGLTEEVVRSAIETIQAGLIQDRKSVV